MKKFFLLVFICGYVISCKDNTIKSISNLNEANGQLIIMPGFNEYSFLKHSFEIIDAGRYPLFRIWTFRNSGRNYGVYQTRMFEISNFRGKDFAGLFELDIESIDTTFDIIRKKSKEFFPKSGWSKLNTSINQHEIWNIPRYSYSDSINEEQYSKRFLEIELITYRETYKVSLSGILNLDKLHDKKSVAITNLFRIMKEEFGIDFLNFDFDEKY